MGCREDLAYNMRRQSWEIGLHGESLSGKEKGKKLHSGVFNQIKSKKNFKKLKKGLTIEAERNKQHSTMCKEKAQKKL